MNNENNTSKRSWAVTVPCLTDPSTFPQAHTVHLPSSQPEALLFWLYK